MKSIEDKINRVNATMSMENMPLSDEDRQMLKDILEGKTTYKKEIKKLITKYRKDK